MSDQLNDAIRATAMLVSYHTTRWTANAPDPGGTKAAASASGSVERAYKPVIRNLMVDNDKRLKAIINAQERGRRTHWHYTLPWTIDDNNPGGPRLIPTASWLDYMKSLAKFSTQYKDALADFLAHYEDDASKAQALLKMPDSRLFYPPKESIADMFSMTVDFTPIPAGAEFKGLPPQAQVQLEESYERRMRTRVSSAMQGILSRVGDPIEILERKLREPEITIREPTVESVRELPDLIRAWNLMDYEELHTLVEMIEVSLLNGVTAKVLRGFNEHDRVEYLAAIKRVETEVARLQLEGFYNAEEDEA